MSSKSIRLTKATRKHMCRTYHLLPHQVLEAEQISIRNRLIDTETKRQQLLQQLEEVNGRSEFTHLLKTKLPQLNHLIERLTNELHRISREISYEHQRHLHHYNPDVYGPPTDQPRPDQP